MASEEIKTGTQVVSKFLESLQGDETIDADTLGVVHQLFKTGNLKKTQLLNALEAVRAKAIAPSAGADAADHD
jgi:hypothetical protein